MANISLNDKSPKQQMLNISMCQKVTQILFKKKISFPCRRSNYYTRLDCLALLNTVFYQFFLVKKSGSLSCYLVSFFTNKIQNYQSTHFLVWHFFQWQKIIQGFGGKQMYITLYRSFAHFMRPLQCGLQNQKSPSFFWGI